MTKITTDPSRFNGGTLLRVNFEAPFAWVTSEGLARFADPVTNHTLATLDHQKLGATFERIFEPVSQNQALDELDAIEALPDGSVVEDSIGRVGKKILGGEWVVGGATGTRIAARAFSLPVTVYKVGRSNG